MIQRLAGDASPLGDREVAVIAATSELGRDGHILEPAGLVLDNYMRNPIVLWQHNPDQPVGFATRCGVQDGALAARISFAPSGISAIADEVAALVKSGIVRGVSIGFEPTEIEPLDPKNPRGGQHILAAELLEISLVSVQADTGARVVARSAARIAMSALPVVSSHAIERALSRFEKPRPLYAMSAHEYAEAMRRHTMTVWALGQAKHDTSR